LMREFATRVRVGGGHDDRW